MVQPPQKLKNLILIWRHHGLTAVLQTAKARANPVCHRIYLMELTKDTVVKRPTPDGLTFRIADRADLQQMLEEGSWDVSESDLECADRGDRCLLQLVNQEMVGHSWLRVTRFPEMAKGLDWPLPEDAVYADKAFTAPKFRGAGFQPLRSPEMLRRVMEEGKARIHAKVDWLNFSSQKALRKAGYRKVGEVTLMYGLWTHARLTYQSTGHQRRHVTDRRFRERRAAAAGPTAGRRSADERRKGERRAFEDRRFGSDR